MHEARERLEGDASHGIADAELALPFDMRQKSRQRARLGSGEEIAIALPRGTLLRGGDLLRLDDGRTVRVIAQPERVMHVQCATPQALATAAYHLGNRHVPLQVGPDWLRLAEDHVLCGMLEGLGARVAHVEAAFEPEAGAYAGAGGAHSGVHGHGGAARLHDHGQEGHTHEH